MPNEEKFIKNHKVLYPVLLQVLPYVVIIDSDSIKRDKA